MKDKFILFIFCFFGVSCATPGLNNQAEQLTLEEEEEFLLEEEEDVDFDAELETPDTEEYVAESEEDAAASEIENIEDEFSEFIEDQEEPAQESPQENSPETLAESEGESFQESPESSNDFEEELLEEEEDLIASDDTEENAEEFSEDVAETEAPQEEEFAEETPDAPIDFEEGEFAEETPAETPVEETLAETPVEETTEGDSENVVSTVTVTNIRYDQGQIFIDTLGAKKVFYRSRFNDATKQLIIELTDSVIADQLKWPYIMKEFQSDFALLQADQKTDNTVRIIIQMHPESKAPTVVQKDDDTGLIVAGSSNFTDLTTAAGGDSDSDDPFGDLDDFSGEGGIQNAEPLTADDSVISGDQVLGANSIYDFLLKDHKFFGDKVTIDVRGAKLKDLLYFLSEDAGLNMIISEKIPDDTISLKLKEVPWDQALILIMKRKQLAYVRKGGVITIGTVAEFQDEQKRIEEFKSQKESLAPLTVEVIPLAYAQVSTVASKVNAFKTQKGTITQDGENNSLIVYDTVETIQKMRALIKVLDRVPKQVMIAAKIVEVTENFSQNFGVNWGFSGGSFSIGPNGGLQVSSDAPLNFLTGSSPNSATLGSHLRIGTFDFVGDLDARFGISENEGEARVLSSPRIIARNGQAANISQSSESLTFSQSLGAEGGISTTVERTPLNLSLNVTPRVTNVNTIYMTVSMSRSFQGAREGQGESSAAPTNSRSANTEILLKSGQTAVIGGVYETQERESLLGFPILRYIPVVKWLFSQTNTDTLRTELLLFITPRVISIDENLENTSTQVSKLEKDL